jgi:hypothetical protein
MAAKIDNQTLVPASISFSLGSEALKLADAQLSLKFTNGSGYDECMSNQGKKNYVLRRGTNTLQEGDITIKLIKTPEAESTKDIKTIQDNLAAARKATSPKDYKKPISIVLYGPAGDTDSFFGLTFEGYVSELNAQTPELTNFMEYIAQIEVFDPSTIKLDAK